ncbi:MAG: DUF4102 domain-containing protein, partial [Proteobacteria bacterium]|nr:DUF4102 domain-containing protein [Pseudomonadota bacterium]
MPSLTDARIRNAKTPAAGQIELRDATVPGMTLRISYGGTKTFGLVTRLNGRQRRYRLGAYPGMSLAEARDLARAYKIEAGLGRDPKTVTSAAPNTFGHVVKGFIRD